MFLIQTQVLSAWLKKIEENIDFSDARLASSFKQVNSQEELTVWSERFSIESHVLVEALASVTGIPWKANLDNRHPSKEFVDRYPISLARSKGVLGFELQDGEMHVALSSANSLGQVDVIGRFFDCIIRPFFAPENLIRAAINSAYQSRDSQTVETIESLDPQDVLRDINASSSREDLLDSSGRSPVIKLVNSILYDAVQNRASDIHIQPFEDELRVRFRIDGVLFDQFTIPKSSQEEVLSRIKVIGEMNIAEKRLPLDGRASVQIGDRMIDLRIASIPTSFGERIVIRLLDKSARLYTLEEIGMPKSILATFQELIRLEHGLIMVTGPTGSGKSTTLYSALQEINTNHSNVVTLEDPIEYQLPGISQTQVSEKKGMTFASGLRSVLRQDPDIIMVGEIRDQETAEMAIQSALTGHMVFSTLHTNDAPSAISRMLDLGIEPYLIASSLIGVLAQRLVRRICTKCKREDESAVSGIESIGINSGFTETRAYSGAGCNECRETGYQGRIGLFELMHIDDSVRSLIQTRQNASSIREQARANGMKLLREDGLEKIGVGLTTVEEVVRVSMQTG